jgi:hypothetical protein
VKRVRRGRQRLFRRVSMHIEVFQEIFIISNFILKGELKMNKKNRPVDNLLNAANNVLKNVLLLQKKANDLQNVYTDVARQWR